jgi:cytochrome c556
MVRHLPNSRGGPSFPFPEATMKQLLLVLAFLTLLAGDAALPGQTRAQPKPSRARDELMAAKLKHAKLLLEGIALADFKKIQRSAEELIQLSKTAEWRAVQSPRYELYTNEFRRAGEELVQKARAQNIDGVTLHYFEMTLSCVRCHKYLREVRDARLLGPHPDTTAAVISPRSPTLAR